MMVPEKRHWKTSKGLLVLGLYALDRLDSAGPVRIFNLYQSLQSITPTRLIAGTRSQRRWRILKYLTTGQIGKTRYVYVESATSYATETDLLLLLICRLFRKPIMIFIRDAHQLFPEIYDRTSVKVRVLDWLWRRSVQVYLLVADVLLFPSAGLAWQFKFSNKHHLLPPAGKLRPCMGKVNVTRRAVLYVGASSQPNGVDLLVRAMRSVVQKYPDATCLIVTDEASSKNLRAIWEGESWVQFVRGSFNDLPDLMRSVYLTVIPRRVNAYNDLALPVKLFDYLSFGKPVVVTNCTEQARYVRTFNCGLVVEDTAESVAAGILRLFDDPELAQKLGANGYQAIQEKHAWKHRAEDLLALLESLSDHEPGASVMDSSDGVYE